MRDDGGLILITYGEKNNYTCILDTCNMVHASHIC